MAFFKFTLLMAGIGMFVVAGAIVTNDAWLAFQYRRKTAVGAIAAEPQPIRWRTTMALACLAWAPILIAASLVIPGKNTRVWPDQHCAPIVAMRAR